jgi:acetate---CoA ligase (ADP-forming)
MSLERVLNAQSVAIVGASKDKTKRGFQAIKTLLDEKFDGPIYPINPKENSILGLKCYASICDVPGPVDMALIATPARTIPGLLGDCGAKNLKGAVIIAGGFRETGLDGKRLEAELKAAGEKAGVRFIGPNTSGMINFKSNLNLVGLHNAPKGNIALISQSGNMALALITEAQVKSLKGFSYYVGVGNEADIQFHEYLEFFGNDPDTKAILMYVEGMRDGRKFLQQAYKTSLTTPIVLLKSGRTATGQKAAGSHTGALAGISAVSRTAFARAGILVIEDSDKLFPAAETVSSLPPIKNNRVAILADGGGHATIAADLLTDLGLEIPELDKKTQARLRKILPAAAAVSNPVDVAGGTDADPTIFADCAEIILKDANIGGLLVVGLFGGYGIRFEESLALMEEDAAHRMGKLIQHRHKPILVHSLYSAARPHSHHLLRYYNIPVYDSVEVATKCISVLADYGNYLQTHHGKTNFVFNWGAKAKREAQAIIATAKSEGRSLLLEHEVKKILHLHSKAHSVPVTRDVLTSTAEEAVAAFEKISAPVALKIASPDIMHKSDAGGVRLDLRSQEEIREAYENILKNALTYKPDADIRGVVMAPMAPGGVEVIIGTKIDDQFGPVIMFGMGGIFVEVLKDVVFRVLPISYQSAKTMVDEIKTPLLNGMRGKPACDKKTLHRLLLMVSEIIEAYPEIREMDLNPVIVHEKGLSIADARIILRT